MISQIVCILVAYTFYMYRCLTTVTIIPIPLLLLCGIPLPLL